MLARVRPEYGPSLPTLLAPRFGRLPRALRLALAALGAIVVLLIAIEIIRPKSPGTVVVVRAPIAFNLVHAAALRRVAPQPGELLRLQTIPGRPLETFSVRPITLPPYRGDASSIQPVVATGLELAMAKQYQSFRVRGEGRTRINSNPGYSIDFQVRRGGHTAFGTRYILFPNAPAVRRGLDVTLLSNYSPTVPNIAAVGNNGPLKQPLRSLRFGTQRP